MKRIIYLLLIAIFCIAGSALAQEKKKMSKEERKAAEKELGIRLFNQAKEAIENKSFVLEADRIVFKYGQSTYVTSTTNFVSVNDDKATVQIAFPGARLGPNGLGGITVDGTLSKYVIKYDKKGNLSLSFSVQGIGISAQVLVRMSDGSNIATADISPNFNSNRMTMRGSIIPLEDSNIFKGRSF